MSEVVSEAAGGPRRGRSLPFLPAAALLAAVVALVHGRAVGFAFVNLDDQAYVYGNPAVLRGLTGDGVRWAFTTFHAANWHPLTWLSHMLDVELFGPGPAGPHAVNLLLHAANAVLLLAALRRATGAAWRSAAVAALFAVHPLHVESVAWVSERKDLLSTLLGLLALLAYLRAQGRSGAWRMAPVAALLALSLLAKPMLVTFPFLLLLLDAWPLGRLPAGRPAAAALGPLLREKLPLLLLSAASCAVTFAAQRAGGATVQLAPTSLPRRLANALVSSAAYLRDAAWPAGLAAFYPHPYVSGAGLPAWEIAAAAAVLAACTGLALRERRRRPYLLVGWLWFLGMLVPVVGLVQVGGQARADRYTYLPLVGIFLAAVWGGADLLQRLRLSRRTQGLLAGAAGAALAAVAWHQVGFWRDSVTLHRRALSVTERNWEAASGLCDALGAAGQLEEALAACQQALALHPQEAASWNRMGATYGRMGRHGDAQRCFEEALRLDEDSTDAWQNLGTTLASLGQLDRARGCFRRVLAIRPADPAAWRALAVAGVILGDRAGALEAVLQLERVDPPAAAAIRRRYGL